MNNADRIKELQNIEAIAELWMDKVSALVNDCRKARRKLEGVSTSSNTRKGEKAKAFQQLVANRNKRMLTANR